MQFLLSTSRSRSAVATDQGLVDNAMIGNLDLPHRDPITALVQKRLSEIQVSFEVLGKAMER
jgi:hypothetical protein